MTIPRLLAAVAAAFLLFWGHRQFGWPGVAGVAGGLLMWLLLHVTRLMTVMQRAAQRPIGHVDSAVMLNARLRPGLTLLHVVTLTRALGARESAEGVEPEVYRWTDAGGVHVRAEFTGGRLQTWALGRPGADGTAAGGTASPASAP